MSKQIRIETLAAKIYFAEFTKLIPSKYGFESRNQSSLRITKRRASDVINGLLNYGYTVLAGEISKFVLGFALFIKCPLRFRKYN